MYIVYNPSHTLIHYVKAVLAQSLQINNFMSQVSLCRNCLPLMISSHRIGIEDAAREFQSYFTCLLQEHYVKVKQYKL